MSCAEYLRFLITTTQDYKMGHSYQESHDSAKKILSLIENEFNKLETNAVLAKYKYPLHLLPNFHTAIYQLIVGVEQKHSQSNLDIYAKNLRELANKAFFHYKPHKNDKQ